MAALVWVMVGLAIWHFTIFLPDRFWGGIVGAFLGALVGGFLFGLLVNGLSVPGQHDTDLVTAIESIPGAVIGIALVYFYGARQEQLDEAARGGLAPRR
jgi:predicted lipid-binding transport protein (Tim44 family)